MVEYQRDIESVIEFLNFAKNNGYIRSGTADNRIRAVKTIFGTVKNIDTSDITKIDLEDLSSRYTLLVVSKIPAATLRANMDHLKGAIREFNRYLADPGKYRPESGRNRGAISKTPSKKTATTDTPSISQKPPSTDELPSVVVSPVLKNGSRMPSLHIDIQVHISPQSSDTQIDKVFESMARHLKDLYSSTK